MVSVDAHISRNDDLKFDLNSGDAAGTYVTLEIEGRDFILYVHRQEKLREIIDKLIAMDREWALKASREGLDGC